MRQLFLSIILSILIASPIAAQDAQQPTIMVMPDRSWCVRNHYVLDGTTDQPDYHKALADQSLSGVLVMMGDIMSSRGYQFQDLEQTLNSLDNERALDMTHLSKGDGMTQESELDMVVRNANADIIVYLDCEPKAFGPRTVVEFKLKAVDAASYKQIAGDVGNTPSSGMPLPTLLKECAVSFMDHFCDQISRHLEDIYARGREGTIMMSIADDCPIRSFEEMIEYEGETGELADLIDYWLDENTVNGVYTQNVKTRNKLNYKQVRFPLIGASKSGFGKKAKSKSLNMDSFIKPLGELLSQYGISMSTTPIGQGSVHVVLGGL